MASPFNNKIDSDEDFALADNIPLAKLQKELAKTIPITNQHDGEIEDDAFYLDYFDDSDYTDPTFIPGPCELKNCKKEVFAACTSCLILLCYDHFLEDPESCSQHGKTVQTVRKSTNAVPVHHDLEDRSSKKRDPESFHVEGLGRQSSPKRQKRINKKKNAKQRRQSGQEYISEKTKKIVKARIMRKGCVGTECLRTGRQCSEISEVDRQKIFEDFYELAELEKEREFVARHIETMTTKTVNPKGRRQKTHKYFLTNSGQRLQVCKNTFLATLGIGDKFVRVVLEKITETGIVERDKRGGRQSQEIMAREEQNREKISQHIDRFPRVESHYCRASSSKEYLNSYLSLPKIYAMFLEENQRNDNTPSFSTYRRVFKTKNLAFHHPKKDQCSLCNSYLKGDEEKKDELREVYNKHTAEKLEVRRLKQECKEMAEADPTILAGSFDLQQVIYLPVSNEDALFYKRKLSNYNLTFYNLADNRCDCYTWHEGQSRRGSSEISTAVFMALKDYDKNGVKSAFLFADGCPGQNKNTIMASMMLNMVNFSFNIEELSLRYFESFHGQCEGDSAHSAINTALEKAGDLFLPSQLSPIFTLARRKHPYKVHALEYDDFLDFKKLSEELKILNIRKDDTDSGIPINWSKVMEVRVTKASPSTIFFKTSHLEEQYRSISLKRQQGDMTQFEIAKLNSEPNKISKEKYADLMSMCSGKTPLIRNAEHKAFYFQLPHNE